jgi:hypothetical protein
MVGMKTIIKPATESKSINLDTAWTAEDEAALNFWIDQREVEAIAQQEHWDYIAYGQEEQEARREYFSKHPWEPYDSPDAEVYIEI